MVSTLGIISVLTIGYFVPRQWGQTSEEPCSVTIYIDGNNAHTNLIVPVKTDDVDWQQHLNLTEIGRQSRGDYRFLSFGWGDRIFYLTTPTWQDLQLTTLLRALLLPTDTVLHIQGHQTIPPSQGEYQVKPIAIGRTAHLRLSQFLLASFALDPADQPIRIRESHRYAGSFYAAQGYYSLFQSCNNWTATGLRLANVNTPLWSSLAPAIFHHAQSNCQTHQKD
ncbi:MAG: TIGR02117 family protein [Cyanothece sp. SIO1E1]|nr:TIGR02117 family protein [Cyanothece sp. SIO1E1]